MIRRLIALCWLLAAPASAAAPQGVPPLYRDAHRPIEARVADLLGRMSLEEKFWQLFMIPGDLDDPTHDYSHGVFGLQISTPVGRTDSATARTQAERINAIQRFFVERTRLGIPIIPFDEGLHGLVREGATVFPQAIALAATWDTSLMERVAATIARETRVRGIRQVLSPVLNIASDARWGRVEETYGEDPFLVARMGRAFVQAFELAGIAATPKHFIANVGDGGRDSYPADINERNLEEYFFPPFKDAVRAGGARSVMSAYNSVDGVPATQNRWLLRNTLKRDWGFGGVVISDAAATAGATVLHLTEASTATAAKHAIEAGLDVIFQSSWEQHRPYLAAFRSGQIDSTAIDSAVARVLRLKFGLGLFEQPYADPDSAAYWNGHSSHHVLAREAARASLVLLRNRAQTLPLAPSLGPLALIGVDATQPRLGGYSAPPSHVVSIRDAFASRLGPTRVRYAPGPGRVDVAYAVVPSQNLESSDGPRFVHGLRGEYFDNNRLEGAPRVVRTDDRVDFGWTLTSPAAEVPFDWYSIRWTGRLTVPTAGLHRIGIEGNDGYRLWLDGHLVIDNWRKVSYGTHFVAVSFAPASRHDIRLEYFESTGGARLKLVWDAGVADDWRKRIDSAVAITKRSAAAVVVVGIEEGEFRDRASLRLPGHQEELIDRVAATGKPTIVVLTGGSAITMSRWIDHVDAVVDVWYPGVEGGHAIVEALLGDFSPAGRLPITFPLAEGQLPLVYNHKPSGRGDDYVDLTGQPLFPFGYGLSYTTFTYRTLQIAPGDVRGGRPARVTCRVRNSGTRPGDEVVQLYLRDVLASVARPVMQLAAFRRVHLTPGEETEVEFQLSSEQLQMLDRDGKWVIEPGVFRVMVGGSSRDIQLRGELVVP